MASGDDLRTLTEAAIHGDAVALADLVRETQPLVWRLCHALGSAGEEEDLVQETYLQAMRSLRSFRGDAPVRAWLAAIARNVCADHVRRRARLTRLLERLQYQSDTPEPPPDCTVDDLIGTLEPGRRDAFVLTQVAGLSYDEAAAVLGCPIGTIRSRVSRARSQLIVSIENAEAQ